MRPLNLDHLQSYVVVLEAGSISAAAPRLCLSPSAISEQLRKLEDFVGMELLRRGKKGVGPTPAGERLLTYAREMLLLSDRALEDARGVTLHGELRLAITDYFRPSEIPPMLQRLRKRYPQLRLHVTVQKSMHIERQADSDAFDIGLSMRILDGRSLPEGTPVCRESLHWVASAGFELDEQAPLPLLALPKGCSLRDFAQRVLEHHGIPFVVAHSASGVAGLQSALSAGLGIACLNTSSLPDGVEPRHVAAQLPPLPDIEFSLLPPRPGVAPLVGEVRDVLLQHLGSVDVST